MLEADSSEIKKNVASRENIRECETGFRILEVQVIGLKSLYTDD